MALTLAQIKALSQDKLTGFVIDEFRKSPLLDLLVFDNTVKPQGGTTLAYTYNRVTTQPTAAGRAINSEYTAQETLTTQQTVNLKIFGGSFEIDRVLAKGENGQVVDNVEFQTQQKVKATRALFHDWFINGDSAVDATAFEGIDKIVTGTSTELASETIDLSSAAAVKENWNALTYYLRKLNAKLDGAPSAYLMSEDMYGVFQAAADFATGFTTTKNDLGEEVLKWGTTAILPMGDKPGTADPVIATDEATGTTDIYAIRIGLDGVHGVSIGEEDMFDVYLPNMEEPGAVKKGEVEAVAAIAAKATRSVGVLRNIKIQPTA